MRPPPPTSTLFSYTTLFRSNTSSYYGEIYRAGIESVGRGQWDAARSTGLSAFATLTHVVLPQAVRRPRRSEEHTSELQSRPYLVCRLLLEKKKQHLLPTGAR